jgi:histidine ammonia-lyase
VSSNGQEDHVSMGANAATQAFQLVHNVERVLAIELLNASQALHFRLPLKSSPFLEMLLKAYRKDVSFIKEDEFLHDDIQASITFVSTVSIDNEVFLA